MAQPSRTWRGKGALDTAPFHVDPGRYSELGRDTSGERESQERCWAVTLWESASPRHEPLPLFAVREADRRAPSHASRSEGARARLRDPTPRFT
jgi:hypothetical protein